MTATITIVAINIATIICSGPHEAVHLKRPAISKKNVATISRAPVIDTSAVIIREARIFIGPSLKNGRNPAIFNINIKKPMNTPRTTISCCHVASSSIPSMSFKGALRKLGRVTSFSRTFSVLISSPPLRALSCSFAWSVRLSSARASGITNKNNRISTVSVLFMYREGKVCLYSFFNKV